MKEAPAQNDPVTAPIFLKPEGQPKGNRILIGIPGYEVMRFAFFQEWVRLRIPGDMRVIMCDGVYLPQAHNTMVHQALSWGEWDYLLWIEIDMIMPDNLLDTVRAYTDPVVGAMYFTRRASNFRPIPGMLVGDSANIEPLTPEQLVPMLEKPGLYPVDTIGMGCTAIRRDVFEKWPEDLMPWYAAPMSKEGRVVSDDVWFCRMLKKQKVPVKVDTRLLCGHIGSLVYDHRTYMAWVKTVGQMNGKPSPKVKEVEKALEKVG